MKACQLLVFALLLPGCISITTSLHPENERVAETITLSDCVPIILGFGIGRASVEGATTKYGTRYITKIRRIQLYDGQFVFFGKRCVEVTGE